MSHKHNVGIHPALNPLKTSCRRSHMCPQILHVAPLSREHSPESEGATGMKKKLASAKNGLRATVE